MLSLWIVRHGETDWNVQGRVQGWTDIPLNAFGEAQAHQLGQALAGTAFARMVASDLGRARKTAEIIGSYVGLEPTVDKRLRERHFGAAEGMIRSDAEAEYPHGAPDAESWAQVEQRAAEFLRLLAQGAVSGNTICVTHGGFVRALMRALFDRQVASPPNTSVTRIDYVNGDWLLQEFGTIHHLNSAGATTSDRN